MSNIRMIWAAWLLGALICLHIYQRLISRRSRRMLEHLPSLYTLPFIGNIHRFIGMRNNLYQAYVDISKIVENTNMPFLTWFGNTPVVVMSDPDDVRTVSTSNLGKSYICDFAKEFLGDGLITASGAIWKQNIKKLGFAFKQSNVDAFQGIFNKQSRHWIESMKAELDGRPFNMLHKYLNMATFVTIAESALGVSVDGDTLDKEFGKALVRIQEILVYRAVNVHLHCEAIFRLTPMYREYQNCINTIHHMTDEVLRQKVRHMEGQGNHDPENTSIKSFLEILLEMREANPTLTEQQIKYEVTTILMAGYETVATTLNFILLVIGCRPEVQRKMFDEICHVFGETGRDVSKEDLSYLCYCEAVIYETIRLYPPVPGCLREVENDVQLRSCVLPKGTVCIFNIYGSSRSTRIWGPDALMYKPERWLDPSTAVKNASAFMGFNTGKRVCIGKRYAFNLLKTMLVHFLMDYEVSSDPEKMTLKFDVLVKPISGNLIKIRRRERDRF